ncbi:histidine kinase [Aquincola sp. S2]|uniref:Histidine kinase n=1 Tax=Pseudaquabacterium terrae TaxID=2732868 RepID=A0ABX2ECI4_9BURK|nr:histidine kinase [Aquabacterium terrae]NRF66311.1 histidine kinase [Aquabacterium terrae]
MLHAPPPTPLPRAAAARFARWWYGDLGPELRAEAEALDRRLVQGGIGLWLGVSASLSATVLGLQASGLPLHWSVSVALLFVIGSGLAMRRAWLQPEKFDGRRLRSAALLMVLATYAGALGGIFAGLWDAGVPEGAGRLARALWRATPAQLLAGMALLLLLWAVASGRRAQIQRALLRSQLEAERDAAARHAAEARLKLLQAQIQPHFLFNTLAALQHWVDTGDQRAAPLLRSLTNFLRGSTELMLREQITLADELPLAEHYLGIMASRFGERLRYRFDVADDCRVQPLPPALLLTLLENAVEHGIAPLLRPGCITLRARRSDGRFELTIADDGAGLAAAWHDGVGLTNSRLRLQHRFGARARLELRAAAQGTVARLTIDDEERSVAGSANEH